MLPEALCPNESCSPHALRRRADALFKMSCANCCGDSNERSREKGSSKTASTPVAARSRSFSGVGVSNFRLASGRRMRVGCGSKVTAIDLAPRTFARLTISPRTNRCARCTPSKFPTLTSVEPKLPGTASRCSKICIAEMFRSQTAISFRHTRAELPMAATRRLLHAAGRDRCA